MRDFTLGLTKSPESQVLLSSGWSPAARLSTARGRRWSAAKCRRLEVSSQVEWGPGCGQGEGCRAGALGGTGVWAGRGLSGWGLWRRRAPAERGTGAPPSEAEELEGSERHDGRCPRRARAPCAAPPSQRCLFLPRLLSPFTRHCPADRAQPAATYSRRQHQELGDGEGHLVLLFLDVSSLVWSLACKAFPYWKALKPENPGRLLAGGVLLPRTLTARL